MRNRFDTWAPFRTNHILYNGTVSQLAWVTPCLNQIRCELWWSVIGGSGALVLLNRSLIAGCVCVKGWGMNQHLSLAMGMVVGLVLVWERLYTNAWLLIYCNSRALGHEHALWDSLQCRVREGVHGKLSLWIIITLIMQLYWCMLQRLYMLCLLLIIIWSKLYAFYAKLNTMTYPCY